MGLRKERPPFGAAESAASSGANSAMSNEQPVSKRQRIDGLHNTGNGSSGSSSSSSNNGEPSRRYQEQVLTTTATGSVDVDELDHVATAAHNIGHKTTTTTQHDYYIPTNGIVQVADKPPAPAARDDSDVWLPLHDGLMRQCLCAVSKHDLQRPFRPYYTRNTAATHVASHPPASNHLQRPLADWPPAQLIHFLSQLQLLFDIYLKQSRCGRMCRSICAALAIAERTSLVPEIIQLADYADRYVQYLGARVLCTFLVVGQEARHSDDWLKKLVANLFETGTGAAHTQRVAFSLEIFRRVLEWNDVDVHPLDDDCMGEDGGASGADESEESDGEGLMEGNGGGGSGGRALPPIENNYFNFYAEYGSNQTVTGAAVAAATTASTGVASTTAASGTNSLPATAAAGSGGRAMRASPTMSSSVSVTSSSASVSSRNHSDVEPDDEDDVDDDDDDDDEDDDDDDDAIGSHRASGCTFLEEYNCFDSTKLKCDTVRYIGNKWQALYDKMNLLMGTLTESTDITPTSARTPTTGGTENLIHTFLELWRTIIAGSAKNAFLTVNDTHPFYADLDKFEENHLRRQLPPVIYKQLLQLFNAVLCYGDALATEMVISEETCNLARRIIAHLQVNSEHGLLQSLPLTDCDNPVSLIGYAGRSTADTMFDAKKRRGLGVPLRSATSAEDEIVVGGSCDKDKTFMQNMVLLVLKSMAVSVRGMRSDSSDSSIDSSDEMAWTEFGAIARSLCPQLEKVNTFAKKAMQLHPALHFSRMLVTLFIDQDDFLIEAMVCTLDVAAGFQFGYGGDEPSFGELIWLLNPVYTFLEFLSQTNRNWKLLLDYLISIETCFLLYFLRFLKYITMHWDQFVVGCEHFGVLYGQRNVCQHTMALLGELRTEIGEMVGEDKFPYDIWPVLKLMDKCSALWECPL